MLESGWPCNLQRRVICLPESFICILTDIRRRPAAGVFGSVISSAPSLGSICWPRRLSGNWRVEVFCGIFGPITPPFTSITSLRDKHSAWWRTACSACRNVSELLIASRYHAVWSKTSLAACNRSAVRKTHALIYRQKWRITVRIYSTFRGFVFQVLVQV